MDENKSETINDDENNIINNSKALINNDDVNVGIKPDVKNNRVVVSLCSCSFFCIFGN
jgi:hypothetical protein